MGGMRFQHPVHPAFHGCSVRPTPGVPAFSQLQRLPDTGCSGVSHPEKMQPDSASVAMRVPHWGRTGRRRHAGSRKARPHRVQAAGRILKIAAATGAGEDLQLAADSAPGVGDFLQSPKPVCTGCGRARPATGRTSGLTPKPDPEWARSSGMDPDALAAEGFREPAWRIASWLHRGRDRHRRRNRPQGLFEVGDEVVGILDADRDPDHAVADAETAALAGVHGGVGSQHRT